MSSKLEGEVTKFHKAMDKLRSDTATEIISVSNSMEAVCEKLDDRLTGHIEETDAWSELQKNLKLRQRFWR